MKRLMFLMCLFAMMAASTSVKAQEVAIELVPGWNWIAYPYAETVDLNTALGSFTPTVGDMIKSQFGSSSYLFGRWRGAIQSLNAGEGYHYFSNRTEPVTLVFGLPSIPMGTLTVTTSEPTNITSTIATCGGSAVSNDGTSILMKGVCWATHPQPTTNDSYSEDGSGPGDFTTTITELDPETVYYVRAYAVSVKGINYGEELSFTTSSPGILNGVFSVSENSQVCFSQGNLQYQASTNTWRFSENQWDYVGNDVYGTVYENGLKCDNSLISSTYSGWIDLFGWGTSGHNHGAVCYQPWSTNENNGEYVAYGQWQANLFDQTGQADWGSNPINNGGNQTNQWRTMTRDEWEYIFNTRLTVSGIRYAKAQVNNVNGVVLLPDDWDASLFAMSETNQGEASYNSNVITFSDWHDVLEPSGAIFLPAAGYRISKSFGDLNSGARYWSASSQDGENSIYADFGTWYLYSQYAYGRCLGGSVRLVRPAQDNTTYSIEAVPNPAQGGTITGAGTYNYYDQVTLTANANEGYTFYQWKENGNVVSTENPYTFVALSDRNLEVVFLENSTYPLLYSYNEDNHTATVIGHWEGVELTGEIVIPETVMHNGESYTVTAIGDWAFSGSQGIISVVIPNTITRINDCAFYGCYGITSLFIPESVTSFDPSAFWEMLNLEQVTVAPENPVYDSRDNCNAIIETSTNTLVRGFAFSQIPNTVTTIAGGAFARSNTIHSITIPSSVNTIGEWAFGDVGIEEMYVLAEVPPTLGDCAFCGTDHSIPVYVPCASIEAYQNANDWSQFTNFIAVGQCFGTVTVTASPAEYGTVSGGGYYEGSATCTVTATPNEGYYFLCWMEDDQWVSSQATYTFPVYRDHNLTAVFYATLGDEMVVNGDFELGNVGFTSGYVYTTGLGNGGYYVDDNPNIYWDDFQGSGHGETGYFMFLDGATEPGINVWTEQIPVEPNTYYVFSAWVCTLFPESMALLQFSINGTQIVNVFRAPSQTNIWEQFNALWYSGNSTTATITILDQNTEGYGNDFGLDDISFREMDPVQGEIPEGAINGKFTINEDGDQVYFSQGNLQYQASTNTWKFAENQWDYVGDANNNISSTYDGWIDLFGWGTSGWNNGNTYYHPWDSGGSDGSLYGPPGECDLTGSYANADWGVYNPISNGGNTANQWRTLTQSEWAYVFNARTTTSGIRYAKANVNNVNGVILLPDDWSTSTYSLSNTNSDGADYSSNTLTALQWSTLEQAGAAFLPAAGNRYGTSVSDVGSYGRYWSVSYVYSGYAINVFFDYRDLLTGTNHRYGGHSVRLVRIAEN